MKNYKYDVQNIENTIITIVSRTPPKDKGKKKNYFIINDKIIPNHRYGGQICRSKPVENYYSKNPLIFNVSNIEEFKDGDVISIMKDGTVNFLYENEVDFNPILVTSRCNANCIACPQPQVSKEEDRTSLNLKLISLMDKNAKTIGVTGGEPTILGDKFLLIMEELKKQLPSSNILLLTNGIRFSDFEFAKKLKMINNNNLQIDIPLFSDTDSDHDYAIGVRGFYKMIKGLHNLTLLEFKIGLRIVIQKMNYQRLQNIAEFIYHNFPFVYHVAFIQMEIYGKALDNLDSIWIDPYDYVSQLESAVVYLSDRRMSVSIYNIPLCLLPKELWKYSKNSISSWKRSYEDICNECVEKENCGGLFITSGTIQSKYIKPILSA